MALPVLDGNQSATTLSSVVTGGEHIVAHSVVSLGTTAISNINSAVSGSAVTIPGLARLSNSIASDGTADANLDFIKIGGHQDGQNQVAHIVHVSAGGAMKVDASGSSVTFSQAPVTFGAITGSASILNFPSTQTIAGTVTANLGGYSQTAVSYSGSSVTAIPVVLQTNGVYGGTLLAYNGANTYLRVGLDAVGPNSLAFGGSVPISGTVTVGNSVTIGSIPAISGTVTANGFDFNNASYHPLPLAPFDENVGGGKAVVAKIIDDNGIGLNFSAGVPISGTVTVGNSVTISSLPAISGTVTIGAFPTSSQYIEAKILDDDTDTYYSSVNPFPISGTVTASNLPVIINGQVDSPLTGIQIGFYDAAMDMQKIVKDDQPLPVSIDSVLSISGTVTANVAGQYFDGATGDTAQLVNPVYYDGEIKRVTPDLPLPVTLRPDPGYGQTVVTISGTVTAAAPNGSLTTRFGTPTTASVAFATSCVTNANRKYLLIQNVTTGSNVITVGIGFTPTTTQGIQLTAGAGITFESSYIPTGQIFVLSSVTASNFTILEA